MIGKQVFSSLIFGLVVCQGLVFGQTCEAEIREIFETATGQRNGSLNVYPIKEGLTNRNFKVVWNGTIFFVRLGHADPKSLRIDRAKELSLYTLVEKDGIAPHLLYSNPETGNLIAPFIKGTAFGKKDGKWLYERTESIQRIAALLRSFHAHQSPIETQINYPFHIIEEYVQQALSSSISLPKNIDRALKIVHRMKSLIPPNRQVLCHQDLVPDNFIFDGSHLYLVDWEYADWGNPFYDLAAVCVEHQFNEEEKQMLLKNYFQTPTEQQRFVLEMMCMLYSLRDCLWYILESGRSQKNSSAFHELADVHYRNFFVSQRWLNDHQIPL